MKGCQSCPPPPLPPLYCTRCSSLESLEGCLLYIYRVYMHILYISYLHIWPRNGGGREREGEGEGETIPRHVLYIIYTLYIQVDPSTSGNPAYAEAHIKYVCRYLYIRIFVLYTPFPHTGIEPPPLLLFLLLLLLLLPLLAYSGNQASTAGVEEMSRIHWGLCVARVET